MKTRKRKVFERVVNPLIIKHLVSAHVMYGRCIASKYQLNICLTLKKYLVKKMQRKLDTDTEVSQV